VPEAREGAGSRREPVLAVDEESFDRLLEQMPKEVGSPLEGMKGDHLHHQAPFPRVSQVEYQVRQKVIVVASTSSKSNTLQNQLAKSCKTSSLGPSRRGSLGAAGADQLPLPPFTLLVQLRIPCGPQVFCIFNGATGGFLEAKSDQPRC